MTSNQWVTDRSQTAHWPTVCFLRCWYECFFRRFCSLLEETLLFIIGRNALRIDYKLKYVFQKPYTPKFIANHYLTYIPISCIWQRCMSNFEFKMYNLLFTPFSMHCLIRGLAQAVLSIVCSLLKLGIRGCDRTQRPMVENP